MRGNKKTGESDGETCLASIWLRPPSIDAARSAAHRSLCAWTMSQAVPIEVLCAGDLKTLCRPCVDCGLITGRYCDYCYAEDRLPQETWAPGQMTPLCHKCDNARDMCHFCAGKLWCTPAPSGPPP